MDIENKYKFSKNLKFNVHSANFIGRKNIEVILNNYLQLKRKEELGMSND